MSSPEASVSIQVLPKTQTTQETVKIVDSVISYIKSSGLKTFVGPFDTTIEGDFSTLMNIVKECHEICIKEGAPELISFIKISYNPKGVLSISEKVEKHKI